MKTSVTALHHQSTDWLKELQFYKDELSLLQNRLGEVAARNTSQEVLANVEHFQNKFIMLNEQVDILKHDVKENDANIMEYARQKPEHISEKYLPATNAMQNRIALYTKGFADTRLDLNIFLSKVL